jgi:RNA polymerase sigma-70 factor, ECF subfamily
VNKAEEFEQLRPLLFSIAYRILGRVGEAEDAVQETWLRYQVSATQPASVKARGSSVRSGTVTSRACANCWPPTSS